MKLNPSKINFNIGLLCFFNICTAAYTQETTYLKGIVVHGNIPVEAVQIKNTSNAEHKTTNKDGVFKIAAKIGDSLLISPLLSKQSALIIKEKHLKTIPYTFEMDDRIIELDEVELNKYTDIDAVSLSIIEKKPKKLTLNEKRLFTAGDFKLIHLLSLLGGSLEVDPIINKITGRTEKIKRHIELDRQRENIHFLENNYYDYMVDHLDISETDMGAFLYYITDQPALQNLIDENQKEKLKFFILDWWIQFKEQQNEKDS